MSVRPVDAHQDAHGDANAEPIDAVIAWVDGSDPKHREKLARTLEALGIRKPATAHPTRFNHAGEIDYCIASIIRHAPWVRRIHVVTDAQTPPLMQGDSEILRERLRLVDHRDIFAGYEQHLPTFNSRAICSMLWRIPDLAEHYIYFNDDMSLLRAVEPGDFFREGKVVTRGSWRRQLHTTMGGRLATWWKHRVRGAGQRDAERPAQELSARLAGFDRRYYHMQHVPYPFRRSTLQAYFAQHPQVLEADLAYPFRRLGQFRAECLAAHLEIAGGGAILDNRLTVVQIKPDKQARWRLRHKMARADGDPRAAFACVQSLDRAADSERDAVLRWLDRSIGRPADVLAG